MTHQTLLDLGTAANEPLDPVGFDIGWDHARHGLVPPPELMLDGTPVAQGWRAARAVFGGRTVAATRPVRQWLELRLRAWREGVAFDAFQLTPHLLGQLEASHCPVTRDALGGTGDTAAVWVRLRLDAAYSAGHLVLMSRRAARARGDLSGAALRDRAERIRRESLDWCDGLSALEWARLATLVSMAEELPPAQAARLPMLALPPNRVRVLNPVQGLQALLTLRLQGAGWSRRARDMADRLPRADLRHDFNLFVGALAARLMGIADSLSPRERRVALEDAWLCPRVQRRWAQFASLLSGSEAESWLRELAGSASGGTAGAQILVHEPALATEGWSLATRGRLLRSPRGPRGGAQRAGRESRPTAGNPPANRSAMTSPSAS